MGFRRFQTLKAMTHLLQQCFGSVMMARGYEDGIGAWHHARRRTVLLRVLLFLDLLNGGRQSDTDGVKDRSAGAAGFGAKRETLALVLDFDGLEHF